MVSNHFHVLTRYYPQKVCVYIYLARGPGIIIYILEFYNGN